jgi:hypothetical protein
MFVYGERAILGLKTTFDTTWTSTERACVKQVFYSYQTRKKCEKLPKGAYQLTFEMVMITETSVFESVDDATKL